MNTLGIVCLVVVVALFFVVLVPTVSRISVIGTTENGVGDYLDIPPTTAWTNVAGWMEYSPAYHQLGYGVLWDNEYVLPVTFRNTSLLPILVMLTKGDSPPWVDLHADNWFALIMPGKEAVIEMKFTLMSNGFTLPLPQISVGGNMTLKVIRLAK